MRDGWEVRSRFIEAETPEQVLAFLKAVERFSPHIKTLGSADYSITFPKFKRLQTYVRGAMLKPVSDWSDELLAGLPDRTRHVFRRWPQLVVAVFDEVPYIYLTCDSAVEVIAATLFIDKALGASYRSCSRSDCRELYLVESKHPRKYCSPECAHLMAVRDSRTRLTKLRKKRK